MTIVAVQQDCSWFATINTNTIYDPYFYISKFNKNEKNILLEMCYCIDFYVKPGTGSIGIITDLKDI